MGSSCKQSCEHNEYSYKFFNDKASFHQANENCSKNGGSLASDLDRYAYETINRCCSFGTGKQYLIGLVGAANKHCMDAALQFQWFQSKNCTNGKPFNNLILKKKQQCITIKQQNKTIPNAKVRNCNKTRRYICQTEIHPSVTPIIQSTKFTHYKPIEMTFNETITSTIIIPTVIGVVVFTFLMVCLFLHKRRCLKKIQNNSKLKTLTNSDLKEAQNYPVPEG